MAKARKKQPAKKRNTKANKEAQSSSNVVLLIVIILIVGGGIYYGLNKNAGLPQRIKSVWQQESENISKDPVADKPRTTSKKDVESTKKTNPTKKTTAKSTSLDGKLEEVKTNEDLPSYDNDNPYYFSSSFDFAWPAYSQNDPIVEHQYYTLKYNEKTEQADWVAYKLTAKNLQKSQYKALNNFRSDPDVQTKSATSIDYKGSGYDRGHLAPAADFAWSKNGLDETFYMSNMSPQKPGFNRGIWKVLEEQIRAWATKNKEIYVVTGPVFKGKSKKIGKTKIAVPDQYFKIVLELQGKEVKGIAFLLNNEKAAFSSLASFAMSIDDLERITKLDFFPSIPDQLEAQIESKYNYSIW